MHASPHKWATWIYLAEFWYNSSYHSSVRRTPFEIVYGHQPSHFGISMDDCAIPDLEQWLKDRQLMLQLIQQHLHRASQQMKFQADKNRSFREFQVGDWVYQKLQPYVQTSVARRASHKLSFKFYVPYQILQRVGTVAYKLLLPDDCHIHPVVHVSQLRAAVGFSAPAQTTLPSAMGHLQVPLLVLDQRVCRKGNSVVPQVLV